MQVLLYYPYTTVHCARCSKFSLPDIHECRRSHNAVVVVVAPADDTKIKALSLSLRQPSSASANTTRSVSVRVREREKGSPHLFCTARNLTASLLRAGSDLNASSLTSAQQEADEDEMCVPRAISFS